MLARGNSVENARPVAIASRATNESQQRYPQIDLKALAIDFALRRFRNYLVGSPTKMQAITNHQLLSSIFHGKRQGSIRTEGVKQRHQDIIFDLPWLTSDEKSTSLITYHGIQSCSNELGTSDLNNLLYKLHTTPVLDCIGYARIAQCTKELINQD